MEDDDPSPTSLAEHRIMYRSYWRVLGNVICATLGSLYVGYCMAYITVIPFPQIQNWLNEQPDISELINNIRHCLWFDPSGGLVWVPPQLPLQPEILEEVRRPLLRNSLRLTAATSIVGSCLTFIPSSATLIMGRFIQGICVGFYSTTVPIYINEICPVELSGSFGALNQLFIITGILLADFMALLVPVDTGDGKITDVWWVIFGLPIVIALAQISMLSLVYRNETPRYLLTNSTEREDDCRSRAGSPGSHPRALQN